MKPFVLFLRSNRAALGMLAFTLVFYAFFLAMNREAGKSTEGKELKRAEALSKEELKQKEEAFKENIKQRPGLAASLTLVFLVVLLAGLGVDGYLLGRRLRGLPFLEDTASLPRTPWGLGEVFRLFVFLFFLEVVIVLAEMIAAPWVGIKRWNRDALLMANSLVRNLAVALWVVVWVRRRFRASLASIGLTAGGFWNNIRRGLVGYLAIVPVLFGILLVISWTAQCFSYEPAPQAVVQIYLKSSSDKYLLFFTLFVALIGPAIEEIFFRGFTYTALRSRWGVKAALFLSAALFALLHMNFVAFLPIFVLGVFLAYLYEKTGSLVPSMTVHMTHNFLMVNAALFFKGIAA